MIFADIVDPMCSLERHFYAKFISFYFFDVARPLQHDMKKLKKIFCKKQFECNNCKTTFKIFFDDFGFFLMLSCFQPLIWSKSTHFWWIVIFYYLKKAPKSPNNSKFIKEQEVLTKWTIDGTQHQKNKNWLDRQNIGFLRNT